MTTGTPTKEGDVSTVRDKNVDSHKVSSDAGIGTRRKSLRITLRGTPSISNPAKDDNDDRFTPVATVPNEPKRIKRRKGTKDAKVNGAAPAASGSVGKPLAELGDASEVDELVEHRVDKGNSTVEFKVKWKASGKTSWVPERSLQEQERPSGLLYKYWDELGGRDIATGLDLYHVFKILKRASPPEKSKDARYTHIVQWVGFRPAESTLESESRLRRIAPQELKNFEARELASGAAGSQKNKETCGPGQPRKRAKIGQ